MSYHPRHPIIFKTVLGVLCLVCGCAIYLLFRVKSITIYQWCKELGISHNIDCLRDSVLVWDIPAIVRYSIPDGLYCAAYILLMDAIWSNDKRIIKYYAIFIIPSLAITTELLQYLGLFKGTYDPLDLISYLIPITLYGLHKCYFHIFTNLKTKRL